MRTEKLSVNKVCMVACAALFLLSVAMSCTIYFLTRNILALCCGLLYAVFVAGCMVAFLAFVRRKLTLFSDALCKLLDDMMSADQAPPQYTEEENLFYKIQHRLSRLYEVLRESKSSIAKERADLQELISDISHQVKTPIANLKMLDATLLEQNVSPEKQREFLLAMDSQLDKLDFLMQAMIKTSRLEAGVIALEPKPQAIYDTLAAALGGILLNAEQKKITVTVDCPETVTAAHDRKWTTEALFNILDNAVKYTPESGKIHVAVVCWEMYVKIDISDTGIGIPEQHQGTIFKRFYREDSVHDAPGIGIGLYLTREIITRQGGFIRVASEVGSGSTFSVFLPHS
ncbi:sensor histidine kinase [Agathobacter rectalis]|uniref:histidine kinase n=1 Tax=Agathobacter rectalis TaxID=39491 RepID=A0A3E4M229_9FIRM|nr:HAMP domain-containing sensor histidine kinase [Agathobacter rectalis]RGK43788.1 sensor histidine kinase [Agathobacter rectalis]